MKLLSLFIGLGSILGVSGCVDMAGPKRAPIQPRDILADFNISTKAMFIQLGDTLDLSLRAVALDSSEIVVVNDSIRWISADSARVYVDTAGRVVGRALTDNPIEVIATFRYGLKTMADTANVYVTSNSTQANAVRVVALDSNRVGGNAAGQMPRVKVELLSGDITVQSSAILPLYVPAGLSATYSAVAGPGNTPAYFIGNSGTYLGKFWVVASLNLYGNEVSDSIEFMGLYQYKTGTFTISEQLNGNFSGSINDPDQKLFLQPCAITAFLVNARRPVDIVFSDSLADNDGCDTLPASALTAYRALLRAQLVGGNALGIPAGPNIYIRRSNTNGEVSWFIRDAVTKQRLDPVGGRFEYIHLEGQQ